MSGSSEQRYNTSCNIDRGLEECRAASGSILVDVREADEYASGHIPGAVNAPLSTINNTTLPKDKPLFLYCLRGTRSKRAARILKNIQSMLDAELCAVSS